MNGELRAIEEDEEGGQVHECLDVSAVAVVAEDNSIHVGEEFRLLCFLGHNAATHRSVSIPRNHTFHVFLLVGDANGIRRTDSRTRFQGSACLEGHGDRGRQRRLQRVFHSQERSTVTWIADGEEVEEPVSRCAEKLAVGVMHAHDHGDLRTLRLHLQHLQIDLLDGLAQRQRPHEESVNGYLLRCVKRQRDEQEPVRKPCGGGNDSVLRLTLSPHAHLDKPNRLRPPSLATMEDTERVVSEEENIIPRRRGRHSLDALAAGGELVGQRVERGDDRRRRHLGRVEVIQQKVRVPENGAVLSTLHVLWRIYVATVASEVTTKCWTRSRLSRE